MTALVDDCGILSMIKEKWKKWTDETKLKTGVSLEQLLSETQTLISSSVKQCDG